MSPFHVLLLLLVPVLADEPGIILTGGDHFDDLVCSPDHTVSKDTLLIIYHNDCPAEFYHYQFPSAKYMYFLTFGVENTLQYKWYSSTEYDDLYERYMRSTDIDQECMGIFFFQKGANIDDVPPYWTEDTGMEPLDWIYSQMKVTLTINNNYGSPLLVSIDNRGWGPELTAGTLDNGESYPVPSYPSYIIKITKVQGGEEIFNLVTPAMDITINIPSTAKPDTPLDQLTATEQKEGHHYNNYQKGHARRHLALMKLPIMVHPYTPNGYEKRRIPPKVYKDIHSIYIANQASAKLADKVEEHALFINYPDEPKAKFIRVPDADINRIVREIQPILEEWCNCKLSPSGFEGIWEHQKGNQLFKTVAELATQHVISVVFLIERDMEGDHWAFDIIDFEGEHQTVSLCNGDMLMYETAKLIVGRKGLLKGKTSAECIFHFVPQEGWPFGRENDEFVNYQTGFREPVGNVITDLTINKRPIPQHREL